MKNVYNFLIYFTSDDDDDDDEGLVLAVEYSRRVKQGQSLLRGSRLDKP